MGAEIPTTFGVNGSRMAFAEVYETFKASEYGAILLSRTRWGLFQPKDVSNDEWERILGPDANNGKHLGLSIGLARQFLTMCADPPPYWTLGTHPDSQFTQDEQAKFLLTSSHHDFGETIAMDVAYPDKTACGELVEYAHLLRIARELFPNRDVQEAIRSSVKYILLSPEKTKLGRAFRVFEVVGYMRTGLRAWSQRNTYSNHNTLPTNLRALTYNVVGYNLPQLIEASHIYPPVFHQLAENRAVLNQIFSAVTPEEAGNTVHTVVPDWSAKSMASKFEAAHDSWLQFKA